MRHATFKYVNFLYASRRACKSRRRPRCCCWYFSMPNVYAVCAMCALWVHSYSKPNWMLLKFTCVVCCFSHFFSAAPIHCVRLVLSFETFWSHLATLTFTKMYGEREQNPLHIVYEHVNGRHTHPNRARLTAVSEFLKSEDIRYIRPHILSLSFHLTLSLSSVYLIVLFTCMADAVCRGCGLWIDATSTAWMLK